MDAMIPVSMMTGWLEQYVSALVMLNLFLGQPKATQPLRMPTPESVVQTLNEIARGLYHPSRYFSEGASHQPAPSPKRELVADQHYTVILLNATTQESDFVSVKTGGILFEDPALAVFAAEGMANGRMLAVPLARSQADLESRLPSMEKAIRDTKFSPENFFGKITGFVDPPVPSFSLMQVTGAQLIALRGRGLQSFGSPSPKFYLLFRPPTTLSPHVK